MDKEILDILNMLVGRIDALEKKIDALVIAQFKSQHNTKKINPQISIPQNIGGMIGAGLNSSLGIGAPNNIRIQKCNVDGKKHEILEKIEQSRRNR